MSGSPPPAPESLVPRTVDTMKSNSADENNTNNASTTDSWVSGPGRSQPVPNGTQPISAMRRSSPDAESTPAPPGQARRPIIRNGEVIDGAVIDADENLLDMYDSDAESINVIHSRISKVHKLGLERFKGLQRLRLRQNVIEVIELPPHLRFILKDLEMYDNLIRKIEGISKFLELKSLDLSYNKIKKIEGIQDLVKLENLYLASNRIEHIENIDKLKYLEYLELGANRIREIKNLEKLVSLDQIYLGRNKITEIKGVSHLINLTILDLKSNRITNIDGVSGLWNLKELYLSHNMIIKIKNLKDLPSLRLLDVAHNPISKLEGLKELDRLEDFWASYCQFDSFDDVTEELSDKTHLETVYFEGNPLHTGSPVLYLRKMRMALPDVKQFDAIVDEQIESEFKIWRDSTLREMQIEMAVQLSDHELRSMCLEDVILDSCSACSSEYYDSDYDGESDGGM